MTIELPNEPYFYAAHAAGPRGWEIGETLTRNRVCADMTEETARGICALLNAAFPLVAEYGIPSTEIAAIWRIVRDNT